MLELKLLLKEIKFISEKHQQLSVKSRDDFNIFSILRKEHDEVNLHSRFIYELLNPEGTHRLGTIFLEAYLNEMSLSTFNLNEYVEVLRENDHIDLLIRNSTQAIIIENKIYSEDHSKQLSKYLNRVIKRGYKYNDIEIIYLTLEGEEPNEKNMIEKTILCSYEFNILNWLDICVQKATLYPVLRETIFQYTNLIRKLTNKTLNRGHMEELTDLLLKENNLQKVINLEPSIISSKIYIQKLFWKSLQNKLKVLGYKFDFVDSDYTPLDIDKTISKYYNTKRSNQFYGLKYNITSIDNEHKISLFIEIDWNIYYGICLSRNDVRGDMSKEKQFEELSRSIIEDEAITWDYKNEGWFITWKFPKKKLDFRSFKEQSIFDLLEDDKREKHINEIAEEIIFIIENTKKIVVK